MNLSNIIISKHDLSLLHHEAERAWPIEACGLLLGIIKGQVGEVKEVKIVSNEDNSSVSFTVNPSILYKIYSEASLKSMELIGIFHSHPAPPVPSKIDIHYMMINPIPWLIMSMPAGILKAYIIQAKHVSTVEIKEI